VDPAGHEIIACTFRGAPREDGGFHLHELPGVQGLPDALHHLVAPAQVGLHGRASDVQVAEPEAEFFVHILRVRLEGLTEDHGLFRDLERQGLRLCKDFHFRYVDFHVTRLKVRIFGAGGSFPHLSPHLDDEFLAEAQGRAAHARVHGRIEDQLHDSRNIPQVHEDEASVIAYGVHPSHEQHFPARVSGSYPAAICPLSPVQFGCFPLLVRTSTVLSGKGISSTSSWRRVQPLHGPGASQEVFRQSSFFLTQARFLCKHQVLNPRSSDDLCALRALGMFSVFRLRETPERAEAGNLAKGTSGWRRQFCRFDGRKTTEMFETLQGLPCAPDVRRDKVLELPLNPQTAHGLL